MSYPHNPVQFCTECDEYSEWRSCPECDREICNYCVEYILENYKKCEEMH